MSVTPIRQEVRAPEKTQPSDPTGFPCDIDEAGLALDNAKAIVNLLWALSGGMVLADVAPRSVPNALFAIEEQIDRAKVALFGEECA